MICVSHGEVPQFDQIGAIKNLIVTVLQSVEGRKQEIKFIITIFGNHHYTLNTGLLMSCKILYTATLLPW